MQGAEKLAPKMTLATTVFGSNGGARYTEMTLARTVFGPSGDMGGAYEGLRSMVQSSSN